MSDVLAEVLVLAVAVIAVCKVIELFRGEELSKLVGYSGLINKG